MIDPSGPPRRRTPGRAFDVLAAVLAAALFALASVVGWRLLAGAPGRKPLYADWPPLYADWMPHLGPGTPAALALAAAVVAVGPRPARALPWRGLTAGCWGVSAGWILTLALVDGWGNGASGQLTDRNEYLRFGLGRFDDVGAAVRTFTDHILQDSPDNWIAHIAGHPPGAILTFVGLDRAGLGGPDWAAALIIAAAGSAAPAVLITVRALAGEYTARRAAPFVVLAPWAVWAGVSADGYFAAVGAWGIALLALAATRTVRAPWAAALGAGLLLGCGLHLSYGLVLLAAPAVAVLIAARTWRPLPWALLGTAAVTVAFVLAGFWWWEGYELLHERYYQGVAGTRPYSYWIWANLACAAAASGPAAVAGTRRAVAGAADAVRAALPGRAGRAARGRDGLVLLVMAALLTVAAADLSGMSKAETERIWLPFTLWLLPAAALLPERDHRWWLAAQAAVALAANHLLVTGW